MSLSGAAKGMVLPVANLWTECTYGVTLLTESSTFDLTINNKFPSCTMGICYVIGGISEFKDGQISISGKATTGVASMGSEGPTENCPSQATCTISNLSPGDIVVQINEYSSNPKWSVKFSGESKDCFLGNPEMEENPEKPCRPSSYTENLKCSSSSTSGGGGGGGDGSGIDLPSLPKIPWNIIGGVIAGVVVIVIIIVVVYLVACKKKPPVTSETTAETTAEAPSSASGVIVVNNNNNNSSNNMMAAQAQPQPQPQAQPQYQQAPPQYYQAPPQYYQAPPQYQQAPPQYQQAPPQYQQAPPQYQQAPPQYQQAPPSP